MSSAQGVIPSEACLGFHRFHRTFDSFDAFLPLLGPQIAQAGIIEECLRVIRLVGCLEPLSGRHFPPDEILIDSGNVRESLTAQGCLSRNRATMLAIEQVFGRLERLSAARVYLAEALTGFARRLEGWCPGIVLSEYLDGAPLATGGSFEHQDLTALSFADQSFDLVLVNEIFEHVAPLETAIAEIHRVLCPGGRLISTFPFAYGQHESVVKAVRNPGDGSVEHLMEIERHMDPLRPDEGSMVFQIPGWCILDELRAVGFSLARMHYIASWKHGVLGADIPGIFVLEAQR